MVPGFELYTRQAIEVNSLEAQALALAIHEFLLYTPLQRRLTLQEALSLSPLARVGKRITTRAVVEQMKPKPKSFKFNFHWTELLAISCCLKQSPSRPLLQVILGKIHQKTINLELD